MPPKILGLWRLNTSVLSSPDILPNFVPIWQESLRSEADFAAPHIWWEEKGKPSIRFALMRNKCIKNTKNFLFSALEYCKVKKINSFNIFKAFDKTNISFVLKVMEKMNFKHNFRSWIKLFHTDISTCFNLNGISKIIDLVNNVRQGDPLAMPLFLVNIEPLLLTLNSVIEGLKVGVVNQKEEGYVDDITAVSTNPEDLLKIDKLFTDFEALSGTVLNRSNKCKVMGLGGWKGRSNWLLALLQPVDSVKIYGVHFCPSISETLHLSCGKLFRKV